MIIKSAWGHKTDATALGMLGYGMHLAVEGPNGPDVDDDLNGVLPKIRQATIQSGASQTRRALLGTASDEHTDLAQHVPVPAILKRLFPRLTATQFTGGGPLAQ